jgi:UDP-galactopyranose mutase
MLDYVEQNFGTWTFPGGLGHLADLLGKRLRERRVAVLTATRALDIELGPSGPVSVRTDDGGVPADVVVVAIDPRGLPALARYSDRTTPAAPPTVIHLGLSTDRPLLSSAAGAAGVPTQPSGAADPGRAVPQELVLHEDDGLLVVRSEATAPAGRAAWTVQIRGRLSDEPLRLLARRGLDVRDLVLTRIDRAPADLVEGPGSPYGFRWQGPSTLRTRPGPVSPVTGVFLAGAATGGGGWLPFVGLTAAVVADLIGPSRAGTSR